MDQKVAHALTLLAGRQDGHASNKNLSQAGLLTILSNSIADIDTNTFCQKYRRYRYRYVREKLPRYFCRYFYRYFLLM